MTTFDQMIEQIGKNGLQLCVISSPWTKEKGDPLKVTIRPVVIKQKALYQVSEFDGQKILHRNVALEECVDIIREAFPKRYKQGQITAATKSFHVLVDKEERITVIKKGVSQIPLSSDHNRSKNYILQEGTPIPFLIELGIMSAEGKVLAKKYDKFRQINRFVEMVSDVIDHLPKDRCVEVIDFGCGKAYLTFALYHYLQHVKGLKINITGLDLKKDVIEKCQALAKRLGYTALQFAVGDINHHQPKGKVDLVISLHACDTATDAALEKAVRWDADVILCVPCCQHELYSQVQSKALETLLRHGILRERFAALVTDAARAELLTAEGYDVQILEFIDLEHTLKNLLIRAVKSISESKQKKALERYGVLKQALAIDPSLERRLGN